MKSVIVIICAFLLGASPFIYHLYKSNTIQTASSPGVDNKPANAVNTEKNLPFMEQKQKNSTEDNFPKTNTNDINQNSKQELDASIEMWITDKNTYRTDFNGTMPIVEALEHENLLTAGQDLKTLQSDYKILQTDIQLLIKDTSTIEATIEKYPDLKEDKNANDVILSIAKADDDALALNNIIQRDLDYLAKLINQYDEKGNAKYKVTIWSPIEEIKPYANDFRLQNSMVDQYRTKLK